MEGRVCQEEVRKNGQIDLRMSGQSVMMPFNPQDMAEAAHLFGQVDGASINDNVLHLQYLDDLRSD